MSKLERLKEVPGRGDQAPYVMVNYTAAEVGIDFEGNVQFLGNPERSFLNIVAGKDIPASHIEKPYPQPFYVNSVGTIPCRIEYYKVEDFAAALKFLGSENPPSESEHPCKIESLRAAMHKAIDTLEKAL